MHLVSYSVQFDRLTRSEAAAYLGVNTQTLANWAHTGKVAIPHYKVGRKVIYFKADLDAYLDSTRRTQTA
ncbi:helix-turn-helix domain-containing protein [Salmonella enterica subsp. enterica]|nr:helix-turn-helix domain-containing protein [Salmonella enterica subsp. enterica]